MTKVKNKGNPIYIGPTLCPRDKTTEVSKNDLKSYLMTPGGSYLYNFTLFVIDDDFEKQKKADKEAIKIAAIVEAKKLILPEVTAEIEERIERKYQRTITDLQNKIISLSIKPEVIVSDTLDPAPSEEASGDDQEEVEEGFVFDPEKHSLEHRGRGKYYVMEGEEKVYGPVSKDEKAKFEALIGE